MLGLVWENTQDKASIGWDHDRGRVGIGHKRAPAGCFEREAPVTARRACRWTCTNLRMAPFEPLLRLPAAFRIFITG